MKNNVPAVSEKPATSGSSTKSNELGMRVMQERTYAKRRLVVVGQKVNTP